MASWKWVLLWGGVLIAAYLLLQIVGPFLRGPHPLEGKPAPVSAYSP